MKISLSLSPSVDLLEKLNKLSTDGYYKKIKITSTKEMANWFFESLRYKTRIEAFKRSSGRLQKRWQMGMNQHSAWITNDTPHLGYINNGTGIYGPRKQRIVMRWLIGKIIPIAVNPATIKAGTSYIVGDNGEALIFRKCTKESIAKGGWSHDGIKPMHFVEQTFESFEKEKMESILENYVVKLLS